MVRQMESFQCFVFLMIQRATLIKVEEKEKVLLQCILSHGTQMYLIS